MAANWNILLFLTIIAFALNIGCETFGANSGLDPSQCSTPLNDIIVTGFSSLSTQFYAVIGAFAVAGVLGLVLFGTISFPNPYAIFSLLTLAILQLGVIPSGQFALLGVPPLYNVFLIGIFNLGWLFATLSGYRVGD